MSEQIEKPDDRNQRGVLEQADETVDDSGNDDLQRLRQNDKAHHFPIGQAKRLRRLILALGNRLQAAAHHFRHVGRGKQRHADQGAHQLVEIDAFGQKQRQHDAGHEKHRDQRNAAPELNEDHGKRFDDRHF